MDNIISNLINNDQTRFINKSKTQDNIRSTQHIMSYLQKHKEEAMIISLQ